MTDSRDTAAVGGPTRVARRQRCVAVGALLILGSTALTACSGDHHAGSTPDAASSTYGTLPSFLPTSAIHPDSVLIGRAGKPALTTEGDDVDVRIGGVRVRASVSGPVVPGEGLPKQTEATTCTWRVTLSGATGRVPISAADFTSLDHLGAVFRTAAVPGQPAIPTSVTPGHTVTFELRAIMPTGEGLMRWAPDGTHILASWDFEVEND